MRSDESRVVSRHADDPLPWHADRPLTLDGARAAIEVCFPDLAPARPVPLGSGWDHDAFLVREKWVFRFPRRREVVPYLLREHALSRTIERALRGGEIRTPLIERLGAPAAGFPYPFSGYGFIPGVAADRLPPGVIDPARLARVLGGALTRLHALPPDAIASAGVPVERDGPGDWLDTLSEDAAELRTLLPADLAAAAEPFLDGRAEAPRAYGERPRVIHDDICPDHILVDPASGVPTGLIDFGDVSCGDPVFDLVPLRCWLGRPFIHSLLAYYELPLDSDFEERLEFLARVMSLVWLADTHRMGALEHVAKHEVWVRRAFRTPTREGTRVRAARRSTRGPRS